MDYQACRQRRDNGGTPFTNWIRQQKGLESHARSGYVGTDLDLAWYNYRKAMFMLLEGKEHMGRVRPSQEATESILHQALSFAFGHPDFTLYSLRKPIPPKITYCGYHLIQFENTSPEDGNIYVDGILVTKEQFVKFLQFEWTPTIQCYLTEQEMIRTSHSRLSLNEVASRIKQTTRMNHPEIALLRAYWQEKKREIEQAETMFSDDDTVENGSYGIDPETTDED